MLCPRCRVNDATTHPVLKVLPCEDCQRKENPVKILKYEFTTDSIREGRREYFTDVIQPYRDGVLSKEYIEAYGTSGLSGVSKKDIKNAKYTWKDLKGWHDREVDKGGRSQEWKDKNIEPELKK